MLNNQLDRYLIIFFFPAAALAEYQAGAWQIPIITTIPYTVGAVYAPRFVELFSAGKNREAMDIWRQSALKTALLVVPITMVFVVASEETMELLFTASYLRAAPVFRWYCLLTLGRVATFGAVNVAAGTPRFDFQAALVSWLSNAILCFALVSSSASTAFIACGTALAFIPSATYYCFTAQDEAQAEGDLSAGRLPARAPARGFGIAARVVVQIPLRWPAASRGLPAEAPLVLGTFALLGTQAGEIRRAEWTFWQTGEHHEGLEQRMLVPKSEMDQRSQGGDQQRE